jgi:5-methylcytosine-specific restriction endonuclease McrA
MNKEKKVANQRKYRAAHHEKENARVRTYHAAHKEEEATYRAAHKEKATVYHLEYYAANREKLIANAQRYAAANKKKVAANNREHYARNKAKYISNHKEWRKKHPGFSTAISKIRRARVANNGGKFTAAEWKMLLEKYEHTCLCCGRDDVQLEADHVIPVSQGGRNDIGNRQPLCHSCNSKKHTKCTDYRFAS